VGKLIWNDRIIFGSLLDFIFHLDLVGAGLLFLDQVFFCFYAGIKNKEGDI
jgi:hypothetical protein